jgi:hypothetical protein
LSGRDLNLCDREMKGRVVTCGLLPPHRRGGSRRFGLGGVVALVLLRLLMSPSAAVAVCVGDCSGDGVVTVNEIVECVNVALGSADLSTCSACSSNGQPVVIGDLVTAVNDALNGCPIPVTLSGSCAAPGSGSHGLAPCAAGTPITVFSCDDRTQCLHQQGLTMLGTTTVGTAGAWSVQLTLANPAAPLVFQASVTNAVVYRALGFGTVGSLLRHGLARDVTFAPIDITPVTEAAVRLLDDNGFQNYSDASALQVVGAVEQADANLAFADSTPDGAVRLALQTASQDPTVMTVLQTARNTPTPTNTAVPTVAATATSTPAPTANTSPFVGVLTGTFLTTAGKGQGQTGQVTIAIGANGAAGAAAQTSSRFAGGLSGAVNLSTGALMLTALSAQLSGDIMASVQLQADGSSIMGSGSFRTANNSGTVTIPRQNKQDIASTYVGAYLGTIDFTAGPQDNISSPIELFVANDGSAAGDTFNADGVGFEFQGTVDFGSGAFTLAVSPRVGVTGTLSGATLANGTFNLSNGDSGTVSFSKVAP